MIYYNEFDPDAARWLRNLMADGQISQGAVDERSIKAVVGADLAGVRRAHFFAGIGGWDLALRLAGWPDEREVWTGSCPCQPFSVAGKRGGTGDERHLWPDFVRLIRECRPGTVFGEQVDSKDGRLWLDGVCADLESAGYAVGAASLNAAGLGAPHIRQRLYWVAYRDCGGQHWGAERGGDTVQRGSEPAPRRGDVGGCGQEADGLADDDDAGRQGPGQGRDGRMGPGGGGEFAGNGGSIERMGLPEGERRDQRGTESGRPVGPTAASGVERVGNSDGAGREALRFESVRGEAGSRELADRGAWSDFEILPLRDGTFRRAQPGSFPLVDGIPSRLGPVLSRLDGMERGAVKAARRNRSIRLKGYGNAIVPELAAEFVVAFMETVAAKARKEGA